MQSNPSLTVSPAIGTRLPASSDRRRLGRSIWLYLLLSEWNQPTDIYVRSGASIRAQEIGNALGVSERQARRDLQRLRRAGYVELQNTGRGFRIRLREDSATTLEGKCGGGAPGGSEAGP